MAKTFQDRVQLTVLVDAQKGINELGKLEMEAKGVANSMRRMKKGSEEFAKAGKRLKEVNEKVFQMRQELEPASMTMNQLTRYQRQLNAAIRNMPQGDERYGGLRSRILEVNGALQKQRASLRATKSLWSSVKAEVKQFGMLALAYLGAQEIIGQVGSLIKSNADLSDSFADVQKTTSLSRREVEGLSKSLKKIDTRTSRRELLELARIAGKLGVRGRQDVEGFVRAADKIVVALGDDLGGNAEDTIRQVGKLVDIFKVKDKFGLEQGLIKVGSAINSLGAASTASEAFLVDFTKRLGGIAPNANISIDQVLGLAATLDQLGQTSEVSSTALGQLLVSLANDLPAFSRLAGTSVQEFSEVLENDANKALIMVLEGAKSTKNGLSGMAETLTKLGIDGARAASVVGVLSNNIDLLEKQQRLANKEFMLGTSLANEFAVKNETLAARIEKVQKGLSSLFSNSAMAKALEKIIIGIEGLVVKTDTLRGRLAETRKEFNRDIEVIKNGNFTVEQRAGLIQRLNEKYGQYLPSLVDEKASLSELSEIQKEVNKNILSKIILMDYEKELAQIYQDQKNAAEGLVAIEEARTKLSDPGLSLNDGFTPGQRQQMFGALDTFKQVNDSIIENTDGRVAKLEERYSKMAERIGVSFQKIRAGLDLGAPQPNTNTNATKGIEGSGSPEAETPSAVPTEQEADRLLERWREFKQRIADISREFELQRHEGDAADILRLSDKYQAMRDKAGEFYESGIISESEYLAELENINGLHFQELERLQEEHDARQRQRREEQAEQDKRQKKEELQRETELWNARAGLLSDFSQLITATNQLIAAQGGKQTAFQKQLALVQIAIDTASSISKAIAGATAAAASTGPAAPFALTGYIVSMTASVLAAVAKAQNIIGSAEAPSRPSFNKGGFTGSKPVGIDSNGDKVAGDVHIDEYVVPKWLLTQNPHVADMVSIIEGFRLRRSPELARPRQSGDTAGQPSSPAIPQRGSGNSGHGVAEALDRFHSLMDRIERNGLHFNRDAAEDLREYNEDIDRNLRESTL